jgi:hypothetical protein
MNVAVGSLVVIDMHVNENEKVLWNGNLLVGATIDKGRKYVTITTPTPKDEVFNEIKAAGIKVKGVKGK